MYPRAEYDLPIMSMDVVAKDGNISLGIIDPCPSRMNGSLPDDYNEMLGWFFQLSPLCMTISLRTCVAAKNCCVAARLSTNCDKEEAIYQAHGSRQESPNGKIRCESLGKKRASRSQRSEYCV